MNVLVLNYYPALHPPSSGGELRYYNLYRELSKYFNITLLSFTHPFHKGFVQHTSAMKEYRIPQEKVHEHCWHRLSRKKIGHELHGLMYAKCGKYSTEYHEMFSRLYNENDIIVHEFPYLLLYDVYFGQDRKPRIYNSHNFETSLVKSMYKGPLAGKYVKFISGLENRLIHGADIVFATSDAEREKFAKFFTADPKKIKLAPNGTHPHEWTRIKKDTECNARKTALFIGSLHRPNKEAVEFIIHELADRCPAIDFIIAGGCCAYIKNTIKTNVERLGRIDQNTKQELFSRVDVAINPMFSGAGTNLKTVECLSAGIPLFTTEVGARGYNLIHKQHCIKVKKEKFAEKLRKYCEQRFDLLLQIAEQGREYVNENFSWQYIAMNVKNEIEELLSQKTNQI
ncbi:glycosyltransferase family 4 protein [Cohnella kolymensis]|uniref:glycosyltransferase family 4 protein n=1 Tax=Cohnella kolymensis TaxID=1590652 RepID=UPI0006968000|nr:glycosyltransferase family 4 protein [Cohnella kolymensis]